MHVDLEAKTEAIMPECPNFTENETFGRKVCTP
jgi:hypothetical protein